MADMKDFTSLLGRKSAGVNFGEIAQAYFSQGSKKSNRGRNALIASFLFNAKESAMQSEVMQNLQDLNDKKVIAAAEVKANYDKQFKLQNKYDDIESKGLNEYYDADAEVAFDKYVTKRGMSTRFDGSNEDANRLKQEWKNDFAKNQYEEFTKLYNPETAGRLSTFEAYSEPVLNKFKAERRQITSPSELSLVHKVLNKVGIGKGREQKLETDYTTAEGKFKTLLKRGTMYNKSPSFAELPDLPKEGEKAIILTNRNFTDEAERYGITSTSSPAIFNASRSDFYKLEDSKKNVGALDEIIQLNIIKGYAIENQEMVKKIQARYAANPANEGNTLEQKNRIINKAIRTATGMPNELQDIQDLAQEQMDMMEKYGQVTFTTITKDNGDIISEADQRKEYIDNATAELMDAWSAKNRGVFPAARVKQNIMSNIALERSKAFGMETAYDRQKFKDTPIPDKYISTFVESNPQASEIVLKYRQEGGVHNNWDSIEKSGYGTEILELQKNIYYDQMNTRTLRLLGIFEGGVNSTENLPAGYTGITGRKDGVETPSPFNSSSNNPFIVDTEKGTTSSYYDLNSK